MTSHLHRFSRDERGTTMIEYALMLCFVTLICVGAFRTLGGDSGGFFDRVFNQQLGPALR